MFIKSLELFSYRNIEHAKIEFSDGMNIFYGKNAQGKTNALEAMFLCSATKSFRKANENDLISFSKNEAKIISDFNDGKNDCELEINFKRKEKRTVNLDGMPCERVSDYIGRFTTVLFTPDHLSLVKSAPEERRKFLDLALCEANPVILASYRNYAQLISQKTAVLSMAKQGKSVDRVMLEIYNEKLAEECERISNARNLLCNKLSEFASEYYKEMTFEREKLEFRYSDSVDGEYTKEKYLKLLNEGIENEISAGFACYGVHRDDIKIKINSKNIREYASQGQQRSAVLSMKLAEGDFLSEIKGSMPVFLFDDILSELDRERREYITEKIKGKQVILTSCNEEYFENDVKTKYFTENGNFTKI